MALTAVAKVGEDGSFGDPNMTVSPTRDIQVGEFLVVLMTERDWGISSIGDNSSQTGTANTYTQDAIRNSNDPYCYVYSCKVTRKILSTDVITAVFGGDVGLKRVVLLVLPDANVSSQFDESQGGGGFGASATYDTGAGSTTAQADEYLVGCAAFSSSSVEPGTITITSPWTLHSSNSGGFGISYAFAFGSNVQTATAALEMSGGWGATEDGQQSSLVAAYKGTASGGKAITPDGIAGVTSFAATVVKVSPSVAANPVNQPKFIEMRRS